MYNRIPLDPKLPKDFDCTDNRERGKTQLDAWWDHPYGVTREDGRIDVRCLNGGAWDRSMWLGIAEDYDDACVVGAEKQAEWVRKRSRPVTYMKSEKEIFIVVMPQRPDEAVKTVAGPFATTDELNDWFAANKSGETSDETTQA